MTDAVLVVKARVDHRDGETKLIALEVSSFDPDYRVRPVLAFFAEVKALLGEAAVA